MLAVDQNYLLVADFTTGILSRVNLKSRKIEKVADGFGGGDGLAYYGNKLYISDWRGGKIWSGTIKGTQYEPKILKSVTNPTTYVLHIIPEMMFEKSDGEESFLPPLRIICRLPPGSLFY